MQQVFFSIISFHLLLVHAYANVPVYVQPVHAASLLLKERTDLTPSCPLRKMVPIQLYLNDTFIALILGRTVRSANTVPNNGKEKKYAKGVLVQRPSTGGLFRSAPSIYPARRAGGRGVTRDSDLDPTLSTDPLLRAFPRLLDS